MTQSGFAALVDVDQSFISAICKGRRFPHPDRTEQWCKALGLRGKEAEELADAIAIAASPKRAQQIISRLHRELLELRAKK